MSSTKIEKVGFDPIALAHEAGIRSHHAYAAALGSIVFSWIVWAISRGKSKDKAQADRWGTYVGHWAPTLFAIGLALKSEE